MLFNSYPFIFLFLPVVFIGTFFLGRHSHRLATLWLGLASLMFYAVWDVRFVLLLLGSILFNYGAGYWISIKCAGEEHRQARHVLVAAIAANLILLSYFKYTNFFVDSINDFLGSHIPALSIILPLGISFFTFTQITYLVDVYRGVAREYNFIHYLLFVTYFPHLIAGPVLHHKQMMPQFADPNTYHIVAENVAAGLTIFVLGLAKKVLIADDLAQYATPVFDAARDGQALMLIEAWIGALAYTLQLYFDFSGYSDMAIGLSLMLNVRLPLNFDSPYKATSIIDFWRRWHISLSTFLRDYLYIPLGGNRKGVARRYVNLMATMLLGGLWHGAGWTFVIWGGLHGLFLTINYAWRELKTRLDWCKAGLFAKLFAGALTFLAVVVGWVFFRAENFASAWTMLSGMAGMNGVSLPPSRRMEFLAEQVPHFDVAFAGLAPITGIAAHTAFTHIALGLAMVWLLPNVRQMLMLCKATWEDLAGVRTPAGAAQGKIGGWLKWKLSAIYAIATGVLFFVALLAVSSKPSKFLYFQF